MIDNYSCDVLVVGCGAAGIRAAIESHDLGCEVIIACKKKLTRSGSSFYKGTPGWGLCGAVQKGDSPKKHLDEILSLANGTADEDLAGILTEQVSNRIGDLESYGIEFKKNDDGTFLSVKPCFSKTKRSVSARGMDKIREVFSKQVKKRGLTILENCSILGLLDGSGQIHGAYGVNDDGVLVQIDAKSVILATGGAISLFENNYSIGDLTGDGYSMALDAGADLVNLEFIQFIPATASPKNGLPFEQRALPYLDLEKSNELVKEMQLHAKKESIIEILSARATHGPFSTRDCGMRFDEAIDNNGDNTKLYFKPNIRTSDNWVTKSFAKRMSDNNIDIANDGISLRLFAQAFNGGILIDENASTAVKGLYACGEVAGGMHGADRMGGCAMASTQVFGKIAGENAAQFTKSKTSASNVSDSEALLVEKLKKHQPKKCDIKSLKPKIRKLITSSCSCLRNEKKCTYALNKIDSYENRCLSMANYAFGKKDFLLLKNALECYHMVNAGKAIITMIKKRSKSIGPHNRVDGNTSIEKSKMHLISKSNGEMVVEIV